MFQCPPLWLHLNIPASTAAPEIACLVNLMKYIQSLTFVSLEENTFLDVLFLIFCTFILSIKKGKLTKSFANQGPHREYFNKASLISDTTCGLTRLLEARGSERERERIGTHRTVAGGWVIQVLACWQTVSQSLGFIVLNQCYPCENNFPLKK